MTAQKRLAAFAAIAFLISLVSLALAIKTESAISRQRAAVKALEATTNKPEHKKAVQDLRDRIQYLEYSEYQPMPTWVSRDDVHARQVKIQMLIIEAKRMLVKLEAAERSKALGENQIRGKMPWMYVWYGLAFTMAVTGVIVVRYRRSLQRSMAIAPSSITGQ